MCEEYHVLICVSCLKPRTGEPETSALLLEPWGLGKATDAGKPDTGTVINCNITQASTKGGGSMQDEAVARFTVAWHLRRFACLRRL